MKNLNVIAVFDIDRKNVLMCQRRKNPYKGLLNLNGGHVEPNEDGIEAAYRELYEETTITKDDILLTHLMDFNYFLYDIHLEVYFGTLNKNINVVGDENELCWIDINENFFDTTLFAGEGNIGHMMESIKNYYNL